MGIHLTTVLHCSWIIRPYTRQDAPYGSPNNKDAGPDGQSQGQWSHCWYTPFQDQRDCWYVRAYRIRGASPIRSFHNSLTGESWISREVSLWKALKAARTVA